MADETIIVQPDELRTAAKEMDAVATSVHATVTTLYETLSRLGDPISVTETTANGVQTGTVSADASSNPPWGTDSYGKKFGSGAEGYTKTSVNLLQGGYDMASTLAEFAKGMHQAADGAGDTEDVSSSGFGSA
ncbi:hypothetical protein [Nocardia sp. alder85J]|uniref:hypothetical protein n=1 Tax=Nocardia sp. alder85J TaxID=2862949 RepID=UPI001CD613D1|nr:hypothetical protein [Nocardia sp. alder85J]MCX4093093.1 hypothetical protein [Nocardia sp. alder85J]